MNKVYCTYNVSREYSVGYSGYKLKGDIKSGCLYIEQSLEDTRRSSLNNRYHFRFQTLPTEGSSDQSKHVLEPSIQNSFGEISTCDVMMSIS